MSDKNWFKNAVIYHILIDRFAGFKSIDDWDKPIFLGGNIRGIIDKLDYLKDLGINTIWISPFYKTNTYHGYHITDFFSVEKKFGSEKDLIELIEKIHNNKMKIIADFVPNHCSNQHPFFLDAQKNYKSEYKDWFYFKKWPNDYLCFLSIKELPKINLDNFNARAYMINAAKHWLSLGFDGFRLDHIIGPSYEFWRNFSNEIHKTFPSAVLIGEAWMMGIKFNELKTINLKNKYFKWFLGSSSDSLFKEYFGILDGVLDFKIQELLKEYFAWKPLSSSKQNFWKHVKKHYKNLPKNYFLPVFLDNHDMNRFLFECRGDNEKLKAATETMFSIEQPKIIYYGTEIGMTQYKSIWDIPTFGDIQARQPMNWNIKNEDIFSFYKNILKNKK